MHFGWISRTTDGRKHLSMEHFLEATAGNCSRCGCRCVNWHRRYSSPSSFSSSSRQVNCSLHTGVRTAALWLRAPRGSISSRTVQSAVSQQLLSVDRALTSPVLTSLVLWVALLPSVPSTRHSHHPSPPYSFTPGFRAALSIWWTLRTSPCRGPSPSVDRRVRWMCRAPGWQGAPDGQQAKK